MERSKISEILKETETEHRTKDFTFVRQNRDYCFRLMHRKSFSKFSGSLIA